MTAEPETNELVIQTWAVLPSIRAIAADTDPARRDRYAAVDVARVRRAVDRAEDLLAGIRHAATDDEQAIDMALAQTMLTHACVLLPPGTTDAEGV
jgi:hypothetical protein